MGGEAGAARADIQVMINGVVEMSVLVIIYPKNRY